MSQLKMLMKKQLLIILILSVALCQTLPAMAASPMEIRKEVIEYILDPCALRVARNTGMLDKFTEQEALRFLEIRSRDSREAIIDKMDILVGNVESKDERIEIYQMYGNDCGKD